MFCQYHLLEYHQNTLCHLDGDDSAALIKQHHELVKRFAGCLLEEYENATATHPHNPQWMKQLLLPHLEEFHQVSNFSYVLSSSLFVCLFVCFVYGASDR